MVEPPQRYCSTTISCFFFLHLHLHLHLHLLGFQAVAGTTAITSVLSRRDFPPGFRFGAGSSAYQIEGAVAEDGRKPDIWDTFTHSGKIEDHSTGDITADQYHHYKEDVKLMYETGLDAYRFSISWSRLIPDGHGVVNPKGLSYYNNLINELVKYGIEPHVTLSHFDLPQVLEDEYQGFLSRKIIEDFTAYADLCFREFGDRVKNWMTFCQPNTQTVLSNDFGVMPPGRCSYPFGSKCSVGDSTTEPYIAAHNIILSHAAAALLYKEKYQEKQRGLIGITLLAFWFEPSTNAPEDVAATKRMIDFHIGWFMDPLIYGNYPTVMRKIVGSRLPVFTWNESKQLMASYDFIGLNHYSINYVYDIPISPDIYGRDYVSDVSVGGSFLGIFGNHVKHYRRPNPPAVMLAEPWGLQRLLEYVKVHYKNPAVMIHENGYSMSRHGDLDPATCNDTERIDYLQGYVEALLLSLRNGSNVGGYFVWAFMDVFEWLRGYSAPYGLYGVDFNDKDRKRYPRLSAHWYSSLLGKSGRKTEPSTYLSSG